MPGAPARGRVRHRGAATDGRRRRSSFPRRVSGIVAALILGISRAIGETMVVAIAAGATGGALRPSTRSTPGRR